ncbi:pre-peptidase [Fimbriiglobus ruber]|uniref:Putative serine proteinase, subtilase family n=1 Tax=Fimbriiglobus ruber TaxID=1908690 RepID=A0A225DHL3_9BACT|nr:pre-peptidase [Fimbriiglobus ruber]OWK39164.1 putative serine proteinase, subtilase family [Fimbriiglobus ruber]
MRTSLAATAALLLCLFAPAARADSVYPMLMSIGPVAVQVGTTAELEVSGRYDFQGAYKVFVTGTGVTGVTVAPAADAPKSSAKPTGKRAAASKIKVRFTAAADALPGVREVRVATPHGVSTVGQLVVVTDPVIREAANNDTMKTAQPVTLPATLCGAFEKAEDVDVYKFKAAAGQAFTFHVRAQRLEDKIHDLQEHADPIVTLRNTAGTVLAVNDNFFFADPLLSYKFATAGEYYLEIRDVRYDGNADWQYCIEATDRPFVTNVHPMQITPGVAARVELVGFNLPADPHATLTLPADTPDGPCWAVATLPDGRKTNPVPVVACRLPAVLEAAGDNDTAAKAQAIPVPAGVSGKIAAEGDVDCYALEAKAGEKFAFEVVARGHQSAIDPFIRILNDKGVRLVENDDYRDRFTHADSRIETWTAPSSGRFVVEVRDAHFRGGPAFVYFLKVTRPVPSFVLELDTDKTLLTPGTTAVIFARVTRKNGFDGEVQLAIDGLPPGVTAKCGRVLAAGRDGCILLTAAADAKLAAANVRVTGTAADLAPVVAVVAGSATTPVTTAATAKLTATAQPLQEIYMPGGGRYHYPVETHAVSVGDPRDIRAVKLSTTDVVLKPGESKRIEVTIERAAGFKQNVTLDTVYQHLGSIWGDSLPPGVTIDEKASLTTLSGGAVKAHITLKAAPDAKPVEKQQIAIMAHVSINFVMKFTYCGEPVYVTVTKP